MYVPVKCLHVVLRSIEPNGTIGFKLNPQQEYVQKLRGESTSFRPWFPCIFLIEWAHTAAIVAVNMQEDIGVKYP